MSAEASSASADPGRAEWVRPDIPDYELIRPIGKGGFGQVWLACSDTGVYRAVKVVPHGRYSELERAGIRAFEVHARQHPNLITMLHVGATDDYDYYVMDLADGFPTAPTFSPDDYEPRTLAKDIERRGPIPLEELAGMARQLLSGLGHLHAHGLIYRDVKPANVIFRDGVTQWTDVGLVVSPEQRGVEAQTPLYAAPEGSVDRRADLFAMGLVLYELVTGRSPRSFPEWPTDGSPDVQEAFRRLLPVIERACAPEVDARFQTAEAFGSALEKALPGAFRDPDGSRAGRGFRGVRLLAVAVTLVALGILAWQYLGIAPPPAIGGGLEVLMKSHVDAEFSRVLTAHDLPLRAGNAVKLKATLESPGFPMLLVWTEEGGFETAFPTFDTDMAQVAVAEQLVPPTPGDWWGLSDEEGTLLFVLIVATEPFSSAHCEAMEQRLDEVAAPPALEADRMLVLANGAVVPQVRGGVGGDLRGIRSVKDTVHSAPSPLEKLTELVSGEGLSIAAIALPQVGREGN